MRPLNTKEFYRIIDANFNRSKEALRVCEDVARFALNHSSSTLSYKKNRHTLTDLFKKLGEKDAFLAARDVSRDVGKGNSRLEFGRKNIKDIFFANSQRAKESVRVLEEFAKLSNKRAAQGFKKIRYQLYVLERDCSQKL